MYPDTHITDIQKAMDYGRGKAIENKLELERIMQQDRISNRRRIAKKWEHIPTYQKIQCLPGLYPHPEGQP